MKFLLLISFISFAECGSRANVCYDQVGCFTDDAPFNDLPLPWEPSRIDASFALYTRSNRNSPQFITTTNRGQFNPSKLTKVLIHGFNTNSAESSWMKSIKDKLLTVGDFNVVIVDWGNGAQTGLSNYEQAASNTRVVGVLVSQLLQSINAPYRSVHCIGHSLGAHTCGYAGAAANGNLQRITGLDPAGPNFRNKPTSARLDADDALFVDNIHTHGDGGLLVNFGIGQPIGDVDFFPNGGGVQPGCWNRKRRGVKDDIMPSYEQRLSEDKGVEYKFKRLHTAAGIKLVAQPRGEGISCSHGRAYEFFEESITSSCGFTASPCQSLDAAQKGQCSGCGSGCQRLGYNSDKFSARGIFYLSTNNKSPYCKN